MGLISKERAYAIASQWGSFITNTDPGACLYALFYNDGRPRSEEHRMACLIWLRSKQTQTTSDHDYEELMKLIRFMANTTLHPAGK